MSVYCLVYSPRRRAATSRGWELAVEQIVSSVWSSSAGRGGGGSLESEELAGRRRASIAVSSRLQLEREGAACSSLAAVSSSHGPAAPPELSHPLAAPPFLYSKPCAYNIHIIASERKEKKKIKNTQSNNSRCRRVIQCVRRLRWCLVSCFCCAVVRRVYL